MPDLTVSIPSVRYMEPSLSSASVRPIPDISLYFTSPMRYDSVGSTDAVNKGLSLFAEGSDTAIPVTFVAYDQVQKKLTFRPSSALGAGLYRVLVEARPDGFLNSVGRSLSTTKTFAFRVGGSTQELPKVDLRFPENGGITYSIPNLTVHVPTIAVTGDVNTLRVEVADTPYFNPPLWFGEVSLTGTVASDYDITPALEILNTDKTFYWRAQVFSDTKRGAWSDINNFYYGERAAVIEDSRRHILDKPEFYISSTGFKDTSSNLPSWPAITLEFSKDLPHTESSGTYTFDPSITLFKEPVFGGAQTDVSGEWVMENPRKIEFIPSESISVNTRYTLIISAYSADGEWIQPEEIYFTSKYAPLYTNALRLRSMFGSLIRDINDDLINLRIHAASIKANYLSREAIIPNIENTYYLQFAAPMNAELLDSGLSNNYTAQMWVTYEAMIDILQMKLYEMIPQADGSIQIGDYREEITSAAVLKFLEGQIAKLRKEQMPFASAFSRSSPRPRYGIKSGNSISDYIQGTYYKPRSRF